MNESKAKRAHILETFTHYTTAFVVITKGISKFENPEKIGYAIFFIVVGLAIAFGTFFHHKFEHLIKNFKAYVLLLESIVMAIVGYLYLKEGYTAIQYVCFAASLMFFIALIVHLKKRNVAHH
jgi:hypothetical protein